MKPIEINQILKNNGINNVEIIKIRKSRIGHNFNNSLAPPPCVVYYIYDNKQSFTTTDKFLIKHPKQTKYNNRLFITSSNGFNMYALEICN